MASLRAKKEKTLKEMLLKTPKPGSSDSQTPSLHSGTAETEGAETPITRAFMESLFSSLRNDFLSLKEEVAGEVREIRRDVEDLGERVEAIESQDQARGEEIHQLQQEIIILHEQQVDLQTHTEVLENRSRRNNIRVRGTH